MSDRTVVYHSEKEKSTHEAKHYSKTHESSYRYLAYRDIPLIIEKYLHGRKALDYGTGTGYSANLLKELRFDVTGVDVSKEMLIQAQSIFPAIPFYQIENKVIPVKSSTYDLVFSSLQNNLSLFRNLKLFFHEGISR